MKKMMLVVALLAVPAFVSAQQSAAQSANGGSAAKSPDGLSQEDVAVLQGAVKILGDSFRTTDQQAQSGQGSASQAPPTTQLPQKSMAEVADKVVDLGARAIAQAAGTVEKVAPEVWRIMIRQQYAKAAGLLTVPGGMFMLGVFFWFKTKPLRIRLGMEKDGFGDVEGGWAIVASYILPILAMSIFGLWFLNRLADSFMYIFNPEYYAFRDLLVMILNKGQGL